LVRRKRRIKPSSNRTVQQFNKKIERRVSTDRTKPLPDPLPQTAQDILNVLGAGGVAGNAMALAGVCKSDVSHWVKRFLKYGALILKESQDSKTLGLPRNCHHTGPGWPHYYELTDYGSKLLAGSEERKRLYVVFEDMPVKFSVLQWERFGSIDWEKLGQPRNWQQLGFRVTGVSVVKTSKSVIIHPGPLHGFDVDQLEVDAGRIIERVRYILEVKFGMQFGGDGEFCHGPMWQVFRPEAREWIKQGGVVKTPGVGSLDASPKPWMKKLSGVPHIEFENKRHAAIASVWPPVATDIDKRNASAASMYPLYLEEIHQMVVGLVGQVEALTVEVGSVRQFEGQVSEVMKDLKIVAGALGKLENLDKIRESLQTVSRVLSQLVDTENSGQAPKSSQENSSGGNAYVT
jgi:hypothetical protein